MIFLFKMTAPASEGFRGFGRAGFSWDTYTRYRPVYPSSLWSLIRDYHVKRSGTFHFAHDIGAGAGVGAAEWARHFPRLLVSDPVEHNIAAARRNLTSEEFTKSLPSACDIRFEQRAGEDQSWIEEGSLDLVTVCEAIHWMDVPIAMQAIAKTLRPGGTVGLVYYNVKPFIADADMEAANELLSMMLRTQLKRQNGDSTANARAYSACAIGLDFVQVPQELYEHVERYEYNVGTGHESWGDWRHVELPMRQVGAGDQYTRQKRVEDWSKIVDREWFDGYFDSIQLGLEELPDDDPVLEAARQFQHEVGDRKVQVVWPAAVLLASRRNSLIASD